MLTKPVNIKNIILKYQNQKQYYSDVKTIKQTI